MKALIVTRIGPPTQFSVTSYGPYTIFSDKLRHIITDTYEVKRPQDHDKHGEKSEKLHFHPHF